MNAKQWANEIVNGRVGGNHAELMAIADAIDELATELAATIAENERLRKIAQESLYCLHGSLKTIIRDDEVIDELRRLLDAVLTPAQPNEEHQ